MRTDEVQTTVIALQQKNLIRRMGQGSYSITDPFVKQVWLEREAPGAIAPRGGANQPAPSAWGSLVDATHQGRRRDVQRSAGAQADRIQSYPKIAVYPYHLRQRARVGFSDHFRRLHNEPLVEFVNELETGAAWPRWGHE